LEWETAAAAEARLGTGLRQFVRSMWPALAIAFLLATSVAVANPDALLAASPWVLAWFLSPLIACWVSRSFAERETPLSPAESRELRKLARKTWRFFEIFVTAEDHWLPPDNFQEDPRGMIAHRTSPTNAGLFLLSTLSGHDLGYDTLLGLAARVQRTLDTLD